MVYTMGSRLELRGHWMVRLVMTLQFETPQPLGEGAGPTLASTSTNMYLSGGSPQSTTCRTVKGEG